jgi:predicted ABC-type ATPase
MPTCWIIAGPDGAGKTTFALEFLPQVAGYTHFIDADLIAAGVPAQASQPELMAGMRLVLEVEEHIAHGEDFAFEATLAERAYLRLIERMQDQGWQVELIFLALPSAEIARLRAAERAAHGSTTPPAKDLARRFTASLRNLFSAYGTAAHRTRCFLNSGAEPEPIFEQHGDTLSIFNLDLYQDLARYADLDTPDSETAALPADTKILLESLKKAVTKALAEKKRLGQYAVFWEEGRPVLVGDDAP